MKILFITCTNIGDAVITTGVLSHLLERYPSADFTIAAGPPSAPLFAAFPKLERLIVVRQERKKKHWIKLWKEVRHQRWDLVVDLRGSLISFFLRAKSRKIFHSADKSKSKLDQLGAMLGLRPAPPPALWVDKASMDAAEHILPRVPLIVLIPISNSPFKDWPIDRFAELGNRLIKMPVFSTAVIAVLGLERQRAALSTLLKALPAVHVLDLIGKTDIPLASAILKRARLVIGNDSGLLHMAGALKAPLVGLYGPTNDVKYAPRGEHVRIAKVRDFTLSEGEIQDSAIIRNLSVDQVEEKVRELLNQ